jgi:hypothetical protein
MDAERRYALELKLVRGPKTRAEGLAQLTGYPARLGCAEGWLLLFDVGAQTPWEQRLSWETTTVAGRTVHVVGAY